MRQKHLVNVLELDDRKSPTQRDFILKSFPKMKKGLLLEFRKRFSFKLIDCGGRLELTAFGYEPQKAYTVLAAQ